jgi:hypothetical protein
MRAELLVVAAAIMSAVSCGGPGSTVRTDETGAEGHRAEAERERAAARQVQSRSEPRPALINPGLNRAPFSPPVPDVEDAAQERRWHAEHARDHEQAARELERLEEEACRGIDAGERARCPLLGPVATIQDLPRGVRIELAAGASPPAVLTSLRCHHAFARARGFRAGTAACPLDLRGIEITGSAAGAIEIIGSSRRVARELQKRARQQAVPARPSS